MVPVESAQSRHVGPTVDYEVHGHLDGGIGPQVAEVGALVLRPQLPGPRHKSLFEKIFSFVFFLLKHPEFSLKYEVVET